jgi:phosphate-selective porin
MGHGLAAVAILSSLLLVPSNVSVAAGQAVTTEDLERLRQEFTGEVQGLRQENAALRTRLEEYDKARDEQRTRLDAIELSIDESEGLNAGYDKGFYIKSADDKHKLTVSGFLQFQGNLFEHNDIPKSARPVFNDGLQGTNRDDTFFLRRARLKFKGHLWTKDLGYTLQIGWDGGSPGLKDAYMEYKWANWARVRLGQFKPPFSMEAQESDSMTETIERAAIVVILGMGRRTGIKFYGDVLDKRLSYGLMVANKVGFGNQGRNSPDDNDGKVVIGEVVAMPWRSSDNKWIKGLKLSGAAAHGNNAPTSLTVHDLVSIGGGRNRVRMTIPFIGGQQTSYDLGLQWVVERFKLQGEYLWAHVDRRDVPVTSAAPYGALGLHPIEISGAYLQASYAIWKSKTQSLVPVVKYEWMHVRGDDRVDETFVTKSCTGCDLESKTLVSRAVGSEYDNDFRALTVGVTWHINPRFKIMGNWVFENIGQDLIGRCRLDRGENTDQNVFMIRSQIKF